MPKEVYITKISKFLPNKAVSNDEMEEYLGRINGLESRVKRLILRHNGIKTRYYALEKGGKTTHTNTEIAVEAIKRLEDKNFSINDIELLTSGSASPDYMMPSMASMIHGKLGIPPIDVMSAMGSCNSSMWALNYAWMSILTGKYNNAVCVGTERLASWMTSKIFEEESKHLEAIGKNPFIAFEKEFLRWMLSDGAAAALIRSTPNDEQLSLRIDWIEIRSYANEVETCMFAGGVKDKDGDIIPWREYSGKEWGDETIFALQQDSRLLEKHITKYGMQFLNELIEKYNIDFESIDYFLPHLSSEFFREKIQESLLNNNVNIPYSKWFTNLHKVGNVAAASGFLALEELLYSGNLKKGDHILVMIPESARFSYTYIHLTAV